MRTPTLFASALLLCGALLGTLQVSAAKPRAVPGGANQTNAVSGRMNVWAFNGQVRVKITQVVDPRLRSYAENPPAQGEHYLVVRGIMSNGTNAILQTGGFTAWLTDADGITIEQTFYWVGAPQVVLKDGNGYWPAAGATRLQFPFRVPESFQPATLLMIPKNVGHRAFRIRLNAAVSYVPSTTASGGGGNAVVHSTGKPCYVNSGAYASIEPCFGPAGTQLAIRLLRSMPTPPAKLRFDRALVNGVSGVVVAPRHGAMAGSGNKYVLQAPAQLCMGPGFPKKWFVTLIDAKGSQEGRIGEFTVTGC